MNCEDKLLVWANQKQMPSTRKGKLELVEAFLLDFQKEMHKKQAKTVATLFTKTTRIPIQKQLVKEVRKSVINQKKRDRKQYLKFINEYEQQAAPVEQDNQ